MFLECTNPYWGPISGWLVTLKEPSSSCLLAILKQCAVRRERGPRSASVLRAFHTSRFTWIYGDAQKSASPLTSSPLKSFVISNRWTQETLEVWPFGQYIVLNGGILSSLLCSESTEQKHTYTVNNGPLAWCRLYALFQPEVLLRLWKLVWLGNWLF